MATRNIGTGIFKRNRQVILLLTTILFLQTLVGCTAPSSAAKQATTTAQGQHTQSYGPVVPTPTFAPSALHGPTNFQLLTPLDFSTTNGTSTDDNGNNTPIDAKIIKAGVTSELQHLLFMVDKDDNVNVYIQGDNTPIKAQVTQRPDGSTAISYTHQITSVTINFAAAVYKNQIIVNYEQQYTPLITENASATDITVSFTTHLRWIAADQIPAAPANGQYQITQNGEVNLSWDPGQNAVAYHVYRIFPDQDQQFQLLGTVKNTTYNDKTAQVSQKLSTMGIAYAIFSVGSDGIENPVDAVISIGAQ